MFTIARKAYASASRFRAARKRFLRFAYGKQWDDIVRDPKTGRLLTEGQLAELNGGTPLTNNLIRQTIKTVVGRYRSMAADSRSASEALENFRVASQLDELDARNIEEFLISGAAVQKISLEYDSGGHLVPAVENVPPDSFFISAVRDPRGTDADVIGSLNNWTPGTLLRRLSGGSPEKALFLKEKYSSVFENPAPEPHNPGFGSFTAAPQGLCRVIEVWKLENSEIIRTLDPVTGEYGEYALDDFEMLQQRNISRMEQASPPLGLRFECRSKWFRYYYAPDGTLLARDPSPFPDGLHPYIFRLYPLTDGEIHPFVEDIIDQQRCINRTISIIDNIMNASAKGLLMYPVNLKPDNLSWDSIADRWTRTGGIIPYISRPGFEPPRQLTASGLDAGASHLLDIQLAMMKNVSGVTDTLLGNTASSNTGVERFQEQIRNATIALADILDTYSTMIRTRDSRLLEIMDFLNA